ncbi:hypothetical protein IMSAGC014_01622 [Bacteroidaceae bacterium]|nr:hypothetical protein IMSAGC014_01622 [Bacteroidaceae bacterium]
MHIFVIPYDNVTGPRMPAMQLSAFLSPAHTAGLYPP